MGIGLFIVVVGCAAVVLALLVVRHQRSLKVRARLMQEAIRNRDFTFRLPTDGLLPGERAMQQTLNQLGDTIRQQVNQSEVESWERLTRVLTHEMMNATAPITSISQSMLSRDDVKGTPLEPGIQAICDTSRHLSDFVASYRKMSALSIPVLADTPLLPLFDDVCSAYPDLKWEVSIPNDVVVRVDAGMLRLVIMNLAKNAIEAGATRMVVEMAGNNHYEAHKTIATSKRYLQEDEVWKRVLLYVGNDGLPIPAENRQSLFVPFFTTKRSGSGIGLSLSRRVMVQQGGMLDLAERQRNGCHAGFIITIPTLLNG